MEGLEQRPQEIFVRASMLQSHLEGAATVLAHTKSIAQQKTPPAAEDAEDEDERARDFLQRADDMISQMRSAKVITSKAIRNLEDLKARSLTLSDSSLPAIEHTQLVASELASSSRTVGLAVFKLLNEEGRNAPFTYAEIISATSNSDNNPFSSVSASLTATISQVHSFSALTNNLAQTVEIPSPPAPPPWQLLAQELKEEAAASSSHEAELSRLKDEMVDKSTALAVREQIVEEMSVKVEVLEKRIKESGGRREKMRELELAAENARSKERELSNQLNRLQQDLKSLETERNAWKKSAAALPPTVANNDSAAVSQSRSSANTLIQIQDLKTQISTLESTIRHLRHRTHAHHLSSSLSFLSEPLILPPPPQKELLQTEARDVLKEMLHLATQPENQMVKLNVPKKQERLKWRPVKETAAWQYERIREEWEGWKEWRDSVRRRGDARRGRTGKVKDGDAAKDVLASLKVGLPEMEGLMKGPVQEVRILRPEEWDGVQEMVGVR